MEQSNHTAYPVDTRNKVKRKPKRGFYDKETVYKILDEAFVCHVGFSMDGQPFVIPTSYGRDGNKIYLHGATTSRMMKALEKGIPVCITVTHVDGLVLARSVMHHSMNYRSVVIFGTAHLVPMEEKYEALKIVTNHIIADRWEESRTPNAKELKATTVLCVEIEQASAKIRAAPPGDDKPDYELPYWAGIVPIRQVYGEPENGPLLREGIEVPNSVKQLYD